MPTRESSLSPGRRKARQRRIDSFFAARRRGLAETCGHGYDYPHKASTAGMRANVRYRAGLTGDHKVGGI